MNSNDSDVQRLLRTIDLEYQAAQLGLTGVALGTSLHQFISARMERIGMCRDELAELIGDEEEATKLIIRQMDK